MFGTVNSADPSAGASQPMDNSSAGAAMPAMPAMDDAMATNGPAAGAMPTAAEVAAQLSSSPVVTSPAPPVASSASSVASAPEMPQTDLPAAVPASPGPFTNYGTAAPATAEPAAVEPAATEPSVDSAAADAASSMPDPTAMPDPVPMDSPAPEPEAADTTAAEAPSMGLNLPDPTAAGPVDTDELLDVKQEALANLAPLVDHIEQTPEEKFRTTMMMIQATDNAAMVRTAYEAAKQITDEQTRAQALLDVINEINYFTQNHPPQNTPAE